MRGPWFFYYYTIAEVRGRRQCYNTIVLEILIPIMGMLSFFSPILYFMKRRFDLKEKQLEASSQPTLLLPELSESTRAELAVLQKENRRLQGRIENLETIVCNVDFELNRRLASLPMSQSGIQPVDALDGVQVAALPAGSPPVADDVATDAEDMAAPTSHTTTDMVRHAGVASTVPAQPDIQVGQVIGKRYRIERLVGRGGMGAVYQAYDEVLGESVALKVISSIRGANVREQLDRFRREASTARRVSSPNVIRIHDLGETEHGQPYISMEYFAGRPLSELISARGTLDNDDGHDILAQVCDGLTAAHSADVIHRDLKPQNILVGPRNAVKLIDFGLAKSSFMPELTATGLIMGTPHYMSPEQIRGRQVDARSDIYALGAVAYHALTGRPPFEGKTPIAIGFAHCSEEPTPPRDLRKTISEPLEAMILTALAKKPTDRPQSAAEFRSALDA